MYSILLDFMVILMIMVLFCSVAVGAADNLLSPKGVNYEVAALMSVKSMMRDDYHVLSGWDINSVDPCTWNMVTCSDEGFVISLDMASIGLSGTLSPSIGNLSHLCSLLMQNNQLSGPVPVETGKLQELQTLDLSDNQLSGEIPDSIGLLIHLTYLRLSKNKLSGRIPEKVASLAGLTFLDMSFNNLSGPLPEILAKQYSVIGNQLLCPSSAAQHCVDRRKPIKEAASSQKVSCHHPLLVSVAVGASCIFVVFICLLIGWTYWYKANFLLMQYVKQDYEFNIGHIRRFSFRELQMATDNFNAKNIRGEGGYGVVYKGCLRNQTMVAVKRLKDPNVTGEVQFQTEVEMIGLAVHRNLLGLYGFCMTPNERLLVYPFMSNGSVKDCLRDPFRERPCLDWDRRMHIAVGAARGLQYLHEQCNPKIIHRDVKAANILLDDSFEAVVGDFGLAKLLDARDSHVTTAVRGTIGHIAPEYLSTGQSSEKTDVFGFGILLVELVTGQKAPDATTRNGQVQKGITLDWVRSLYQEKRLEMVVDRDLKDCIIDAVVVEKIVEVAMLCTQSDPRLRPKMSEVLKVLESISGQLGQSNEPPGSANPRDRRSSSGGGSSSSMAEERSFYFEATELSGPR
ncbi:hypothetical protein Dimus_032649 [Dionaea muscipula]